MSKTQSLRVAPRSYLITASMAPESRHTNAALRQLRSRPPRNKPRHAYAASTRSRRRPSLRGESLVTDPTEVLLEGYLLNTDELQDAEARYPGYVRLGSHGRYGAVVTVAGNEVHYNLIGGDTRHFGEWHRLDTREIPELLQRLARHRAAEAVLGVRLDHALAVERKRKRKIILKV